jgi:hypothetical protein
VLGVVVVVVRGRRVDAVGRGREARDPHARAAHVGATHDRWSCERRQPAARALGARCFDPHASNHPSRSLPRSPLLGLVRAIALRTHSSTPVQRHGAACCLPGRELWQHRAPWSARCVALVSLAALLAGCSDQGRSRRAGERLVRRRAPHPQPPRLLRRARCPTICRSIRCARRSLARRSSPRKPRASAACSRSRARANPGLVSPRAARAATSGAPSRSPDRSAKSAS